MVDSAAGPPETEVGVLLAREAGDPAEWLAEASAFDAAGADALWVESGPRPEWDVLALAAALAVDTFRALLVVDLPDDDAPPAGLARTITTLDVLSRGRLVLVAGPGRRAAPGRLPAGVGVLRHLPGEPRVFAGGPRRWLEAPAPQGRDTWRAARADAAERGASGVVVPAGPLLLDLLRNPEDPGGRPDLHLAQG